MNEATRQFVSQHANDDVRQLALQTHPADVDLPVALDQIQGRQIARRKLPTWAAIDGIVYPPHLSMEQCSSEQTRLLSVLPSFGEGAGSSCLYLTDLTGGFGVDFVFMAKAVACLLSPPHGAGAGVGLIYVERNPDLCALARHNFPLLGLPDVEIICGEAENNLSQRPLSPPLFNISTFQHFNIFYLDPARRDEHGVRTYGIGDCTPNVLTMVDRLMERAQVVIIKLSPMLDWHQAIVELETTGTAHVAEVHIVAVGNECKELLLVLVRAGKTSSRQVYCVNDGQEFSFSTSSKPSSLSIEAFSPPIGKELGVGHLFVPNVAVMKAGCFEELCERFGLQAVGPNSHLFVKRDNIAESQGNDNVMEHFPGRVFQMIAVSSMNKRDLKVTLGAITHANIATRNFPMRAEELRRRLKLKDGGDTYLFATTFADQSHVIFVCRKP